jgi:hypothetical protein
VPSSFDGVCSADVALNGCDQGTDSDMCTCLRNILAQLPSAVKSQARVLYLQQHGCM